MLNMEDEKSLEEYYIPEVVEIKPYINTSKLTEKLMMLFTIWNQSFSYVIPDIETLKTIARYAQKKLVVDIYSGNGYWANKMNRMGINTIASDMKPYRHCYMDVIPSRSESLCSSRNLDDAILFYGYPLFVDKDQDPEKIGYFPELKIWKGKKIIAIVDLSPSFFNKKMRNLDTPTTGDVLKAANLNTGHKWKKVLSLPLKYKFYADENPMLEIYERED